MNQAPRKPVADIRRDARFAVQTMYQLYQAELESAYTTWQRHGYGDAYGMQDYRAAHAHRRTAVVIHRVVFGTPADGR